MGNNLSYISEITLPSGNTYAIKDAEARELISALQGYTNYLGVTTTEIADGVTTTTSITVNGETVTAKKGDIVNYGSAEFIFNGTTWQEFGDLSGLGGLAYQSNASASYTPTGTITAPEFTGTAGDVEVSGTTAGSVTITVGSSTVTNYTPGGSVSVTPAVVLSTTTVNSITDVGTLPSCSLPTMTMSVVNENLSIAWDGGTFDAGALPTKGTDTTVAYGVSTATASASFVGDAVDLVATFTGSAITASGTYTPSGTVSAPTFSGASATITVS